MNEITQPNDFTAFTELMEVIQLLALYMGKEPKQYSTTLRCLSRDAQSTQGCYVHFKKHTPVRVICRWGTITLPQPENLGEEKFTELKRRLGMTWVNNDPPDGNLFRVTKYDERNLPTPDICPGEYRLGIGEGKEFWEGLLKMYVASQ